MSYEHFLSLKEISKSDQKTIDEMFGGDRAAYVRNMQEIDQKLINEDFDGDEEAYLRVIRSSNSDAYRWQDIEKAETYPEFEEGALYVIQLLLGYHPQKNLLLRSEIVIRELLHLYRSGQMVFDEFIHKCEIEVVNMRNREFELGNHTVLEYSLEILESYFNYLPEKRQAARDRVVWVMGYEVDPDASLYVELSLRRLMMSDTCHIPPNNLCWHDLHIAAIIKYREILLSEGKKAADMSNTTAQEVLKKFREKNC